MHLTIIKTALLATIATMAAAAANTTIGLAPQTSDPQALGYQPLGPGPCGVRVSAISIQRNATDADA
jgi:hypothetical protein